MRLFRPADRRGRAAHQDIIPRQAESRALSHPRLDSASSNTSNVARPCPPKLLGPLIGCTFLAPLYSMTQGIPFDTSDNPRYLPESHNRVNGIWLALFGSDDTMPFERWGYQFDGAYTSPDSLESLPGIYVIWCRSQEGAWHVLDVGESENVQERTSNHERRPCWLANCQGTIYYSATYTNIGKNKRIEIENEIRRQERPVCGQQ
jgi:hypothetical protein